MHKNKSQKPGGCKAAKVLTVAELRAERDRIEKLAREHAVATALDYYLPGVKSLDTLKEIVFENWLQAHAFTERFEPLDCFKK